MGTIPRVPALALFSFFLSSFPGNSVNWQLPDCYLQLRSLFWNSNQHVKLPTGLSHVDVPLAFQTHPNLRYFLAQKMELKPSYHANIWKPLLPPLPPSLISSKLSHSPGFIFLLSLKSFPVSPPSQPTAIDQCFFFILFYFIFVAWFTPSSPDWCLCFPSILIDSRYSPARLNTSRIYEVICSGQEPSLWKLLESVQFYCLRQCDQSVPQFLHPEIELRNILPIRLLWGF